MVGEVARIGLGVGLVVVVAVNDNARNEYRTGTRKI